jgi:hypothetical protein
MLITERPQRRRSGRRGRTIAVELRPASEAPSEEEFRRRERELELLIIKAACRRATRLAGQLGDAEEPAVGRSDGG